MTMSAPDDKDAQTPQQPDSNPSPPPPTPADGEAPSAPAISSRVSQESSKASSPRSVHAVEFTFDQSFQRPSTDSRKRRQDEDPMSRRGGDASLPQSPSSPASADGARQRKNSRGASDSSEDDVDHFLYKEDLDKLLIFTKSIPPPNPLATMRELRFVFRAVQLCVAIGSFISLSLSSFDVNYPSTLIGTSGINFMCATSVSSMMVSISCMFLYLFPHLLGIPPVRHPRFSRVEVATDLFWIAFWIAASTVGAVFGNCPRKFFDPITKDNNSCVPWNLSMILGYLTAVMFAVTFTMGVVDLKKYGWGYATGKFSANEGWVGWARGSWASHSDI